MPEGSLNIGRLVQQLGLKNVRELPVEPSIQPVIIAAQASDLVAPLTPPQAWSGREQAAVVGEHGAMQLLVLNAGGAWVDVWFGRFRGAGELDFRIRIDPGDPLTVDPLTPGTGQIFNTGPIDVSSAFSSGTTSVASSGFIPSFYGGAANSAAHPGLKDVFVPTGFRLTVQCDVQNEGVLYAIFWRELPAPLTPTG